MNKKLTRAVAVLLALISSMLAAPAPASPLGVNSADKIVAKYRTAPLADVVSKLKSDFARLKDNKDPAKVEQNIRKQFGDFVLEDENFVRRTREVIDPVFKFAGKDHLYRLVILKTVDPVAFVDDACVVVLSTGMLMAANSDDALSGLVAHEVAHSLFTERSRTARQQQQSALERGQTAFVETALNAINEVEFECDAVATIILSSLAYNPRRFLELHSSTGNIGMVYQDGVGRFHSAQASPAQETRKQIILRLSPDSADSPASTLTSKLLPLQDAIRHARNRN